MGETGLGDANDELLKEYVLFDTRDHIEDWEDLKHDLEAELMY